MTTLLEEIPDFKLLLPLSKYLKFGDSTPAFLFEKRILIKRAREYLEAIKKCNLKAKPFYAIKSNDYLGILRTLVKLGFGLDASSERELRLVKEAGAKDVVFTGPGKTEKELEFALKNFRNIVINVDSFGELERIKKVDFKGEINIGIRIHTKLTKGWQKFGIALDDLKKFFLKTREDERINLIGIHFHQSWNFSSKIYIQTLKLIKDYLSKNFSNEELKNFRFIDIGGGLYRENLAEAYLKFKKKGDALNRIDGYKLLSAQNINSFFRDIKNFYQRELSKLLPGIEIYTEPGRWLSTHCFHILLKVWDIKSNRLAILNGGTDNFGFTIEKKCYYPIINISHPSKTEKKMILGGSLCSTDDIWGYYVFASKMEVGDIILIPFQGDYTYSLAKDFIRPLPHVIDLD